jgi:glycosyltransferase involved in cell wall biosynthesis
MTVGVIAQLIARKGHRHMIRAIPTVLSAEPRARFLILGRGPLRTELERLCRQARIIEQVRFTGYRTDIDKILTSLDPVVHLAEMEGLGVALLESAAAGIPIVASKTGGIPEVVRNGKKGVFPHFHRK